MGSWGPQMEVTNVIFSLFPISLFPSWLWSVKVENRYLPDHRHIHSLNFSSPWGLAGCSFLPHIRVVCPLDKVTWPRKQMGTENQAKLIFTEVLHGLEGNLPLS